MLTRIISSSLRDIDISDVSTHRTSGQGPRTWSDADGTSYLDRLNARKSLRRRTRQPDQHILPVISSLHEAQSQTRGDHGELLVVVRRITLPLSVILAPLSRCASGCFVERRGSEWIVADLRCVRRQDLGVKSDPEGAISAGSPIQRIQVRVSLLLPPPAVRALTVCHRARRCYRP